jgi:ABC-2 type transport system ATP-binding protein
MRILTGYVAPTDGSARIDGLDVVEEPLACRRRIGYLPEGNPVYPEFRVEEALRFAARMHGLSGPDAAQAARESVETAGLAGLERRVIGTCSKGQRQRVGLAQALLHKPDVLILDEPTSGLDPNQQEEMRALIRALGRERTVILSTHILPEVEAVCDRALIINRGRLVADGSVGEIKAKAAGSPAAVALVRADEGAARRAFAALPFATNVEVAPQATEPEVLRVRVATARPPSRAELEAVARAASEAGLPLSGLAPDVASLERIFAELTSEDAAAPAAAPGTES